VTRIAIDLPSPANGASVRAMNPPLLNVALALGIGLLIGLERERSKGSGPARGAAGIRTFALAAVLGALAQWLGGPLLLAVVVTITAALSGIAYWQRRATDPGLTSELALLLVPLLAALALTQPQLAGGLAVVVAVLLAAKPALHRFARSWLSADELHNSLVLALATLVVWPLLPDRAMGPYAAINPHLLWLVVVLVLAIGAVGHVAVRLIGPRYGLPVSGLASGFVSSVATIGAMGARARSEPNALVAAVAGGMLSSLATFVQMALVLAAVSLPVLRLMAPMLLAGGLLIALYGGWFLWRAARDVTVAAAPAPAGNDAFSIGTALLFAGAMAGSCCSLPRPSPCSATPASPSAPRSAASSTPMPPPCRSPPWPPAANSLPPPPSSRSSPR
jgi:uncharacterized membrane protein (DUF4010 family)